MKKETSSVVRKEQLEAAMHQLETSVRDMFESGRFQDYLLMLSKFHNYSFNNILLAFAQNPNISRSSPDTVPWILGAHLAPHWENSWHTSKWVIPQRSASCTNRRRRSKPKRQPAGVCSTSTSWVQVRSVPTSVSRGGVSSGVSTVFMPFSAAMRRNRSISVQWASLYTGTW